MFDTVTGKFERGPFVPKESTMKSWEMRTRDFFDSWTGSRYTSVSHTLNAPEARIGIFGEGEVLNVEASLPKLLHGNNLMTVTDPREALDHLRAFVLTHVEGDIPDFDQMDYLRVDFCHNFQVGSALADYVHTLSKVSFLKHRRTTDESGGVEWWSDNGRRVRVYDKYKEILEHDKKAVAHSTVIVTMRYAHPNLDSKRNATSKLDNFGDNLVTPCTKMQQSKSKVSPIASLKPAASYT